MLKLSDERGAQLKMIAEREGKTVVDAVSDMIRSKIDAGTIPADLPGVSIAKTGETVRIEMPGFAGEVSAIEAGSGRLRVILDADLPEAVGRTILSLAIRHGSGLPRGEGARKAASTSPIDAARKA